MPTNLKRTFVRRRTAAGAYNEDHVIQLECGFEFFPAFGRNDHRGNNYDEAAARKAWPILRDRVFVYLSKQNATRDKVCLRPWAWWEFEAPEQRDKKVTEADQLDRLELLTQADRSLLTAANNRKKGKE